MPDPEDQVQDGADENEELNGAAVTDEDTNTDDADADADGDDKDEDDEELASSSDSDHGDWFKEKFGISLDVYEDRVSRGHYNQPAPDDKTGDEDDEADANADADEDEDPEGTVITKADLEAFGEKLLDRAEKRGKKQRTAESEATTWQQAGNYLKAQLASEDALGDDTEAVQMAFSNIDANVQAFHAKTGQLPTKQQLDIEVAKALKFFSSRSVEAGKTAKKKAFANAAKRAARRGESAGSSASGGRKSEEIKINPRDPGSVLAALRQAKKMDLMPE